MEVVEICRACGHDRAAHRLEDGRCSEPVEMMEDSYGNAVDVPCACPGWPG
jgi:hypothetical protein